MATRRRTLLFLCALGVGAALLPASPVLARSTQDPGATFGGTEAPVTTTAAATSTTEASQTNQTLVESEEAPDQPVFTENRKVAAVIGGLVLLALALLLLTVRYIRVTKPSSSADVEPDLPMLPPDLDLNDDSIFVDDPDVASPAAPAAEPSPHPVADEGTGSEPAAVAAATATLAADAPPAADHDAADEDWEPRTGEHERVEIPRGTTLVRPSVAARRKALGVD